MVRQKRNKVFADSNYFIALQNSDDTLHNKAITLAEKIVKTGISIITSNFIFLETVTVISQKAGRKTASEYGQALIESTNINIVHIDQKVQKDTWAIFRSITKKNMSFIDCSVLAVMNENKIKQLLTFDKTDFSSFQKKHHFELF